MSAGGLVGCRQAAQVDSYAGADSAQQGHRPPLTDEPHRQHHAGPEYDQCSPAYSEGQAVAGLVLPDDGAEVALGKQPVMKARG